MAQSRVDAMPLDLDPGRLAWTELDYRASKGILSATSRLKLESVTAADVAGTLIPIEDSLVRTPVGDQLVLLSLRSAALGRVSNVRLWLDLLDGRALQRDEQRGGSRSRYRAYRMLDKGFLRLTVEPEDGERDLIWQEWSNREEQHFVYPIEQPQAEVTDALGLLVIASLAPLEAPGDAITVPVLTKGRVVWVDMRVGALTELDVDLEETRAGETRRLTDSRSVIEVSLAPSAVDGAEEVGVELLGLKGDIVLSIDAETRIPLQIAGKVRIVGSVRVKLERVSFR